MHADPQLPLLGIGTVGLGAGEIEGLAEALEGDGIDQEEVDVGVAPQEERDGGTGLLDADREVLARGDRDGFDPRLQDFRGAGEALLGEDGAGAVHPADGDFRVAAVDADEEVVLRDCVHGVCFRGLRFLVDASERGLAQATPL